MWNTLEVSTLYRVNYLPFSQRKQIWTISIDPDFNWNENFTLLCIKRKRTVSVILVTLLAKMNETSMFLVFYNCLFSFEVSFKKWLIRSNGEIFIFKQFSNLKKSLFLIFLIRLRFTLVNRSLRSLHGESIEFMI